MIQFHVWSPQHIMYPLQLYFLHLKSLILENDCFNCDWFISTPHDFDYHDYCAVSNLRDCAHHTIQLLQFYLNNHLVNTPIFQENHENFSVFHTSWIEPSISMKKIIVWLHPLKNTLVPPLFFSLWKLRDYLVSHLCLMKPRNFSWKTPMKIWLVLFLNFSNFLLISHLQFSYTKTRIYYHL